MSDKTTLRALVEESVEEGYSRPEVVLVGNLRDLLMGTSGPLCDGQGACLSHSEIDMSCQPIC